MRTSRLLLPALLGGLALGAADRPARADWPAPAGADLSDPSTWPSDPGYGGQWNLWSFMPAANLDTVSAYEASVGSGFHADVAWQTTIGDPAVVIAVLDSGIRWDQDDLVNKFYLNRGELPVPAAACGTAAGADLHDVNGDGLFNVQDYTTATGHAQPTAATICDPRVTDVNGNGLLDPQDLIRTFSDGVDDDGNGWTDDISGWDAYHDDNDPADDTDYGHGTGEAKDSAAETDNGRGDAGVCPRCLVMMVRAGDSFVVDANDFATGVVFAVDSGAAVIQEALGAIDGTPGMHAAIEYAWRRDVTVVASAADEDSFHANLPGTVDHTIYVHATTYDTSRRDDATTFMAFNNCTNYGPQLLLSTPGTGCSSEATGKTAGMVGLILSAAIEAGLDPLDPATDPFGSKRLRPEEIKQLLVTTVDDIYDPADATNPDRYVTYPGWEQRFGYGRTNVGNAVEAVAAGAIPPVVDVQEPDWFDVVDPAVTPTVSIRGEVSYRDDLYDGYDYVVEWAPGVEPLPAAWTELAAGTDETAAIDGELARLDVAALTIDNPRLPEPDVDVDRYLVTVRVRVTLHAPGQPWDGTRGEIRRAFHVRHDPNLLPGFPLALEGSGEGSAKVTDLDGDGAMEIVYADTGGAVHAIGAGGVELPGWPVHTDVQPAWRDGVAGNHRDTAAVADGAIDPDLWRTMVLQGPGVGDLDGPGPGGRQVVVATYDGYVYAWDADGGLAAGFPVELDRSFAATTDPQAVVDSGVFGSPVLEDLDGDGTLEIVVGAMDAHVYAWHHDGTPVAGWPVLLQDGDQRTRIVQTPSIGDIDGDGAPEIVVGTNEDYNGLGKLYALEADGSRVAGWPIALPTQSVLPVVGTGLPNNTALADVDGDGVVDVAACGIVAVPEVVRGDGSVVGIMSNSPFGEDTSSDDIPALVAIANGSFGDLDGDGTWDLMWGGAGFGFAEAFAGAGRRVDFDHQLNAWSGQTFTYLPGFPRRVDDHQFFMNPAVADLDGDGLPEVINGSGGYYVHAWNYRGEEPAGWPKFTGGWIISSPAVGDVDGDGQLDVVVATRAGTLWAWRTTGSVDGKVHWASFHHDDRNTGNVDTPIGFGSFGGDGDGDGDGGCCDAGGRTTAATWALGLGIVAVALGRRRRRRA
ncbi:MAG: VCBS repeat-containing protein [Kofleriaceae bacterium]|nr:VCBS repeat-containing protein [Kofleriaceae bacterium]